MRIAILVVLCASLFMAAEEPSKEEMQMMQPARPAQLEKLDAFVGEWSGTAEMKVPEGEEFEGQTTFQGGHKAEWTLDGRFLKTEGWHEMGGGAKMHFVEFMTWDEEAQKFHGWYFSNFGEHGESWVEPAGENSWKVRSEGSGAGGSKSVGTGTMTIEDGVQKWTWTEKSPMGEFHLTGSSKKKN